MKTSESDIDATDSEALRRANLLKIIMEAAGAGVLVLIYAEVLVNDLVTDDMKERMRQTIRRWRSALLGSPPLTEERIQQVERQVVIEALRTVRYGE